MKKTKKEKRAEKLQKQPLNGHAPDLTQPVEKSSSVPKPVEKPSELKDNSTSDLNTSKKKKNKKEKVKEVEAEEVKSTKKIEVKITEIEKPEKSKKKKKKEKNKAKAENEPLAENSSLPTNSSPAKQKPANSSPATQKPDTPSEGDLNSTQQDSSVSDKKKKKKKDKKKDKLNAASQSAEPEKESTETVANGEESTKKKRKKDKGIKGKLFDESADWDSEGEKKTLCYIFTFWRYERLNSKQSRFFLWLIVPGAGSEILSRLIIRLQPDPQHGLTVIYLYRRTCTRRHSKSGQTGSETSFHGFCRFRPADGVHPDPLHNRRFYKEGEKNGFQD